MGPAVSLVFPEWLGRRGAVCLPQAGWHLEEKHPSLQQILATHSLSCFSPLTSGGGPSLREPQLLGRRHCSIGLGLSFVGPLSSPLLGLAQDPLEVAQAGDLAYFLTVSQAPSLLLCPSGQVMLLPMGLGVGASPWPWSPATSAAEIPFCLRGPLRPEPNDDSS